MRQRSIYIGDDLWRQVKIDAASRGITNSQVVVNALDAYFSPPKTVRPEGERIITVAYDEHGDGTATVTGATVDGEDALGDLPSLQIKSPADAKVVTDALRARTDRPFTPVPKPTSSKKRRPRAAAARTTE